VTLRKSEAKMLSEKKLTEIERGQTNEQDEAIRVATTVMRRPGLCRGKAAVNLILLVIIWICALISYNVIHIYLKYIPGTIYVNLAAASISEIIANLVVGAIFAKLTPKWTLFVGFVVGAIGGACLIFQEKVADHTILIAAFVLICQYGISMAMCACYISTPFVFPQQTCGTAFGICNMFGRGMAILAPTIVEMNIPIPMSIFTLMCIISALASVFIIQNPSD